MPNQPSVKYTASIYATEYQCAEAQIGFQEAYEAKPQSYKDKVRVRYDIILDEDYNNNGDPTDDDTNNNGLPDYLDASVALSIDQFNVSEFKIYPNPASTMLNISFNAPNENNYTLTLTDIQGKVVINQLVTLTESYSLDVSNFSKGVYFLKIENENQLNLVKKIIIE